MYVDQQYPGGLGSTPYMDILDRGTPHGDVAGAVLNSQFDMGYKRPYWDSLNGRDREFYDLKTGRQVFNKEEGRMVPEVEKVLKKDLVDNGRYDLITNATSLRKEEWIELDRVVLRAARFRLRAWSDLAAANSFGGFNGMAKMVLEHETMSDPGEAIVDMNGITTGRNDMPQYQLQALPLPITHMDWWMDSRRLAISRNTGTPFDTTMAEAAARRVAEQIEKTTIGVNTGVTYGPGVGTPSVGRASTVYGYTNFTNRLTYSNNTAPTEVGWTASKTLADVLAMRDQLLAAKFYGPYMLYHSNDWDKYMDNDYILTGGNVATQTLRNRLRSIEDIRDVRRLDFLFASAPSASTNAFGPASYDTLYPFTLLMVQMTSDVARAVNGMDITTIQWETKGGMQLNFKAMCIQVPQLRADFYGNAGLLHATLT
jgi:hypothetical protein